MGSGKQYLKQFLGYNWSGWTCLHMLLCLLVLYELYVVFNPQYLWNYSLVDFFGINKSGSNCLIRLVPWTAGPTSILSVESESWGIFFFLLGGPKQESSSLQFELGDSNGWNQSWDDSPAKPFGSGTWYLWPEASKIEAPGIAGHLPRPYRCGILIIYFKVCNFFCELNKWLSSIEVHIVSNI